MTLRHDPDLAREIYIRAVASTITSMREDPGYYEHREMLSGMAKASFAASEEFNRVRDAIASDHEDGLRIDRERTAQAEIIAQHLAAAAAGE